MFTRGYTGNLTSCELLLKYHNMKVDETALRKKS
jgi:hypothetical protein